MRPLKHPAIEYSRRPGGLAVDRAEIVSRQIMVALIHGNADEAHQAIDQAMTVGDVVDQAKTVMEKLQLSLSEILPPNLCHFMENAGVLTVGQLLALEHDDLLMIRNIGSQSVEQIYDAIERLGLTNE